MVTLSESAFRVINALVLLACLFSLFLLARVVFISTPVYANILSQLNAPLTGGMRFIMSLSASKGAASLVFGLVVLMLLAKEFLADRAKTLLINITAFVILATLILVAYDVIQTVFTHLLSTLAQ